MSRRMMMGDDSFNRRRFVQSLAGLAGAAAMGAMPMFARAGQDAHPAAGAQPQKPLFGISLAQWSLHRALNGGRIEPLMFPRVAKRECGVDAVEYVNQFFKDKAGDHAWLDELKQRCADEGVKSLLIMIDGEGALGHPTESERMKAVENHYRWVDAAKRLGCHSIRVNAESRGSWDEQKDRAADGLRRLTEFAAEREMNVIVENHGGLSSNGRWLAEVMKMVNHPRCGTLPDFGNFIIDWNRRNEPEGQYDRYRGVAELMPYAKAVSAKSYDFDEKGNETTIDYRRMMKIVLDTGYRGYVGIEYEGERLGEFEGIAATRRLLERVRDELAAELESKKE